MVSLWSLAVIAFERWLVICKPLGNFAFKPNHALACCALTWFFAMCAALPPLLGWSRYASEINHHTDIHVKTDDNGNTGMNTHCCCDSISRYIPEGLQCSCGPDWYTTNNKFNNESYVMFLFCFCFAVPFSTIVFCYSQLLITLKMVRETNHQTNTQHNLFQSSQFGL